MTGLGGNSGSVLAATGLCVLLLVGPAGFGGDSGAGPQRANQRFRQILAQLRSEDWKARREGFYQLIALSGGDLSDTRGAVSALLTNNPEKAEDIKLALIRLLERENAKMKEFDVRFKKTGQTIGQDYDTDYYGYVIAAAVTLKDSRSTNVLLGAIATGGMAMRALAEFAPISLDPVLAKSHDPDSIVRSSALLTLQEMLKGPTYEKVKSPIYRSKIKQTLVHAVSDEDPNVRSVAVRVLATLGDTDTIPLLEKVAKNDPAVLPGQATGGKDLYFVRHAANMALADLRAKTKQQRPN